MEQVPNSKDQVVSRKKIPESQVWSSLKKSQIRSIAKKKS